MATKLMSIIVEHDGKLAAVDLPDGCGDAVLYSISTLFPDGIIKGVELPDDFKIVPLSEVMK